MNARKTGVLFTCIAPVLELLEGRRMLSVALKGDVLNIAGTSGHDEIIVYQAGKHIVVSENGQSQSVRASGIGSLRIDGKKGNDRITVAMKLPAVILGGTGNDSIVGGLANDELYGGPGYDWLKGGLGNDLLDGGLDADQLDGGKGRDQLLGGGGDDLEADAQDRFTDGKKGDRAVKTMVLPSHATVFNGQYLNTTDSTVLSKRLTVVMQQNPTYVKLLDRSAKADKPADIPASFPEFVPPPPPLILFLPAFEGIPQTFTPIHTLSGAVLTVGGNAGTTAGSLNKVGAVVLTLNPSGAVATNLGNAGTIEGGLIKVGAGTLRLRPTDVQTGSDVSFHTGGLLRFPSMHTGWSAFSGTGQLTPAEDSATLEGTEPIDLAGLKLVLTEVEADAAAGKMAYAAASLTIGETTYNFAPGELSLVLPSDFTETTHFDSFTLTMESGTLDPATGELTFSAVRLVPRIFTGILIAQPHVSYVGETLTIVSPTVHTTMVESGTLRLFNDGAVTAPSGIGLLPEALDGGQFHLPSGWISRLVLAEQDTFAVAGTLVPATEAGEGVIDLADATLAFNNARLQLDTGVLSFESATLTAGEQQVSMDAGELQLTLAKTRVATLNVVDGRLIITAGQFDPATGQITIESASMVNGAPAGNDVLPVLTFSY